MIGFIIGIVGGVQQSKDRTDPFDVNSRVQAAIIIFTLVFIVMFLIFCALSLNLHNVAKGEKRLLVAVGLSCPFLLIRLIYALIADFGHNRDFNFVYGNPTIYLCMSVLEEFVIILLCIGVGLTLSALPKTAKPSSNAYSERPSKSRAPEAATLESRPMPRQQAPRSPDRRAQNQPPPAASMGYADPPPARQATRPAPRRMKRRGPVTGLIGLGMDLYQSKKDRA
ncbi:hypothetical protein V491_04940 [Pseudogymnoascus sp. VKM F-3775]|nr:hypothetical protein V491_04940 [Pseudogymnoascus sp. VKM F-3775]